VDVNENINFIMYPDYRAAFKALPGDDAKALIDALYEFSETGKIVELPPSAQMAFILMSGQIKRDQDKYRAKCEKNRENGTKGGRPKKESTDEKANGFCENHSENEKANGFCEKRTEPKKANNKERDINIEKEKYLKSIKKHIVGEPDHVPCTEIVEYLNEQTGAHYRTTTPKTKKLIEARMNEGFTIEDFKTVIHKKASQWKDNPEMCKFLRPETLFGTKFEGYLNEQDQAAEQKSGIGADVSADIRRRQAEKMKNILEDYNEADFEGL
jgi:uncharacterized phage protein (TIGR02220 family)